MTNAQEQVAVTQEDRNAAAKLYLWFPTLSSSVEAAQKTAQFIMDGGADGWNTVHLMRDHRLAATRTGQATSDVAMRALKEADDAIREMFRYFDGGETRGSYDGRPERNQLRKAGDATRRALASLNPEDEA